MDVSEHHSAAVASPAPASTPRLARSEWWRGAVIYQIYPRSFLDTNGDGIGDLQGIVRKLDYIVDLGVDAIWISPFYRSPMKDFGYDVSDYRAIDPIFGDLDDFAQLIDHAHRAGIRVMVDQVLSHTSDQHAWFEESRQNAHNAKADWYVWADPKPDGTPPNNWLSVFGGSAWQWEPRRGQYYLHNFLVSQPDLNFHAPAVIAQILHEVEFWLQRGVDGLRLDAINYCFHDALLRDNPAKPLAERKGIGFRIDNPYAFQRHEFDNTQPENVIFLKQLRALVDRYPHVVTLGEITAEHLLETTVQYTSASEPLHMAYNFELLGEFSLPHIRDAIEKLEAMPGDCWPCRSLGNHDVARVVSRWSRGGPLAPWAKLLNAFLLSLKGSVSTYQGEELGLTQADIPPDRVRDPYGLNFWPLFKGRDGCRTPMPWQSQGHACGFTSGEPWLPLPEEHRAKAVGAQYEDPGSILNAFRTFVRWRREHPVLRYGDIAFLDSPADTLCFVRSHAGRAMLVCFNFSNAPRSYELPRSRDPMTLTGHGFAACAAPGGRVEIPGCGAYFAELRS